MHLEAGGLNSLLIPGVTNPFNKDEAREQKRFDKMVTEARASLKPFNIVFEIHTIGQSDMMEPITALARPFVHTYLQQFKVSSKDQHQATQGPQGPHLKSRDSG